MTEIYDICGNRKFKVIDGAYVPGFVCCNNSVNGEFLTECKDNNFNCEYTYEAIKNVKYSLRNEIAQFIREVYDLIPKTEKDDPDEKVYHGFKSVYNYKYALNFSLTEICSIDEDNEENENKEIIKRNIKYLNWAIGINGFEKAYNSWRELSTHSYPDIPSSITSNIQKFVTLSKTMISFLNKLLGE